jgi:MarR family transcriptional regulator, organic hydroperoxide resistance regulator
MVNSSFGFEKPEKSPGFLLWQVSTTWQRLIKNMLEPYGISHAQFVILAVLLWCEETGESPIQSFFVTKTKLDKMTVSSSLKKLARCGLVKRNEHFKDTRAKSVALTSKGSSLTKKLVTLVEEIDKKFFDVINKTEQLSLIDNLNRLADTIKQKK